MNGPTHKDEPKPQQHVMHKITICSTNTLKSPVIHKYEYGDWYMMQNCNQGHG